MNEGDRDAPTEFELMAYVDGELDPVQRLEIEDRLARDPELAAQVMAEMRARDALLLVGNACRSPLTVGCPVKGSEMFAKFVSLVSLI